MKNLSLLLILAIVLLFTACTASEIDDKQNEPQKTSVDPAKVKPPTGG